MIYYAVEVPGENTLLGTLYCLDDEIYEIDWDTGRWRTVTKEMSDVDFNDPEYVPFESIEDVLKAYPADELIMKYFV